MKSEHLKKSLAAMVAIPLATSMVLAGCGGDAKPQPSRSSTATSSPTTTSVPTASSGPATSTASPATDPNVPAAARAHTTAGAEAFVRYFIERWNVAWTRPQAGLLTPLCQASSTACSVYERSASRLVKEGHRYDGNPVTITFIGVLNATNANKIDVLANLVQERRSEVDETRKIYLTDQRKAFRVHFVLVSHGRDWLVQSIKLMK